MALTDIINAIKKHADAEVARIQEESLGKKDAAKRKADAALSAYEQELQKEATARKEQLKKKSESSVRMLRKAELLKEKRSLLDAVYDDALEATCSLPEKDLKGVLETLCDRIRASKGEIRPAQAHSKIISSLKNIDKKHFTIGKPIDAKGGFSVVSATSEEDFTFEHIFAEEIRPQTESKTAAVLFA